MDQNDIMAVVRLLDKAKAMLLEEAPKAPKRVKKEYTEEFLQFWSSFPSSSKGNKPKASRAWDRLSRSDRAEAKRMAETFVSKKKRENGSYYIYVSSYLNGKRWLDYEEEPFDDAGSV